MTGRSDPAAQLTLDLVPAAPPTLDNFVPGRNQEALATLRAIAAGQQSVAQFVHLWGVPGSGRSHLLQALSHSAGGGKGAGVPRFDPHRPVHVVDDVDRLDQSGQAALFGLQNEIRGHPAARLVTAAGAPPAALGLRDDVRTRLAWGLVYRLEPLDDDDKARALAAHLAARGVHAADDLVPHLLAHRSRNLGSLIALLDALDAYGLAQQRPLTLPLLRQWEAERSATPNAVQHPDSTRDPRAHT